MELRIKDERVVLADDDPLQPRQTDPRKIALDVDLANSLHEWARVATALVKARFRGEVIAEEAAAVVSQRGTQLSGRVASAMGIAVRYHDPLSDTVILVLPELASQSSRGLRKAILRALVAGPIERDERPPWGPGLAVAGFTTVVVFMMMMAMSRVLTDETSGWFAILIALIVSIGSMPSLWLARKIAVVRWVALGAASGGALSWIGTLIIALS